MFLLSSFSAVESDIHRNQLLAEAEEHRLAKLVRTARKRATRHNAPPARPPVETSRPQTPRPQQNSEADRRYAVSR